MAKVSDLNKKPEFRIVEVEGIAMYANVHEPKKAFTAGEPPLFSLDLVVDAENAEKLLAEGLKPAKKQIDEDTKRPKEYAEHPGKKVFTFRRHTVKKDGTPNRPPEVVDSAVKPIPKDILIGNGSKVKVRVNPYTTKTGLTGCSLLGVQVLELVKFEKASSEGSGFSKTTGFSVPSVFDNSNEDDSSPF